MSYGQQMAAVLLLPLLLLTQGCEQRVPTQKPESLVVDLTAVTKAVGKNEEINAVLDQAREQLNARLQDLTGRLNTELSKAEQKLGKKPSKDDKAAYARLAEEAATRLRQSRQVAERQLIHAQENLFLQFRNHVREVASQIAIQRGATLVQISGASLLWFNPDADITGEVIARLRARDSSPSSNAVIKSKPVDSVTQKEAEKLNKLVEDVEKNQ